MTCPMTKIQYPTHDDAMKHARIWSGKERTILRVYRCPHCNFWHVTSSPVITNHKTQKYKATKRALRDE